MADETRHVKSTSISTLATVYWVFPSESMEQIAESLSPTQQIIPNEEAAGRKRKHVKKKKHHPHRKHKLTDDADIIK
jgi:hypothetical protein